MNKVLNSFRNLLMVLVFALLLSGVFVYVFYLKEQNTVSLFENRNLAVKEDLLDKSLLDLSYQDTIEDVLADQFPKRQKIVEIKKQFDREVEKAIIGDKVDDLSLTMLGDSGVYQIGTTTYMMNGLMEYNQDYEDRILNRIFQMNQLASDYPEIKFYLYRPVQGHETSLFDEANQVKSYGEYYNQLFADNLDFDCAFLEIESIDDYKEMFFSSDHHWNYRGSYQGYIDIMNLLKKSDEILVPYAINNCNGVKFYGTFSNRTANILEPDSYMMYEIDYDDTVLYVNGQQIEDIYQPKNYLNRLDELNDPYLYHYNYSYFGFADYPYHHYYNENEEGNILVICDSYGAAVANLLASSYQNSYFVNQTTYLSRTRHFFNYDDFIQENNIDTVLFMYTLENYFVTDPEWGDVYKNFDIYRNDKE